MSYDFISLLIAGLTLGFSSGLSPGPLLALTISETLKYGTKTGMKVASAPLLTDTPIVVGAIFLLSELKQLDNILAMISIIGAMFLFYFGIENIRSKPEIEIEGKRRISSLQKAIIANFLNPNPYLFWITIGAPMFIKGVEISAWNGAIFIFTFYLMLVGSKMIIVLAGGRLTTFFRSSKYVIVIRATGILLLALGVLLIYDGIERLNIL